MSSTADRISEFLNKHEHAAKLALTAVTASTLTATTILTYQAARRRFQKRVLLDNKRFGSQRSPDHTPVNASLVDEQLSQTIEFLGSEGAEKLQNSFVIIVGAGGVGSWAALMLLRAGVKKIRIIDFDQVTLSSLNRHAVATLDDVGTPKVKAIKKHFERIAPFVQVDSRIDLFTKETADELLSGSPDYIVDAIDNIDTKLDLIQYCYDRQLKVIASMGAGAKADPSRVQIADISETLEDQLARAVRRKLKKLGIESGVPVVYSVEKPHHVKLLPLEEERVKEADDFAALPEFRSRILPVLGTLPSMFGMTIASFVILKLAEYPNFEPLAIKLREGLYARLHRDLLARESNLYKNKTCPLDTRDIGYIYEDIWQGKSVISGPSERVALTRWVRSEPLSYYNTVCMTKEEAKAHDKLPANLDLRQHYGDAIYDLVNSRFEREKRIQGVWNEIF
ncbi:hypothetical protein BDB00DRAFT_804929 [Zychaea mexicana]|uniref:uncharacterized protein n=1 Tax=Zychaea mexicana TaxID=64656 RepID=UPI0022FE5AC5|nr:uncharacterized protein BDB00DRAFT_804929 [Zychaea mexicana]KAI9497522.1 hypothetical protein BDB00DRAFT_804929 [Zychaea mexicana]